MRVTDIAKAINKEAEYEVVGIRPGEKLHEQMISLEDAPYTYEYPGHYKILPSINEWNKDPERIGDGRNVDLDFSYCSDTNNDWMDIDILKSWIKKNRGSIGKI